MPKRVIEIEDTARDQMKSGVDFVANIVKKTFGVKGRNVALDVDKHRGPLLTNDGVSIAREIYPEGEVEKLGAKLIKKAASTTEDNAGDGTTTTMILMQELVARGMAAMKGGKDPLELRTDIEEAVNEVCNYIRKQAKPAKDIDTLAYTATISCRDSKIGRLVAETVARAKDDGMITLEDNLGGKTMVEELQGLQLRTGYVAKQFINNTTLGQVVLKNCSFMVTNMALTSAMELDVIAAKAIEAGHKVLVVLAQDIGPEFMMWCHINWQRHDSPIKILPVRFNTAADLADGMLRDIAAVTGAKMIDVFVGMGMEQIDQECFGHAKKFVQTKKYTTVLPNDKKLVEDRVKELKAEWKDEEDYRAENIQERIARLRSACFTVRVGGSTDTELKERKTRVNDALNSARAAYEHGVVRGGGITLAKAAKELSELDSLSLILEACGKPAEQLAKNSGIELHDWLATVAQDETVVDPAKVVIEALLNAASQAIQLLLCEAAVVDPEVNQ